MCWLERKAASGLSTIDLVGDGFVLLTARARPVRGARRHLRLGLRTFGIGDGELADPEGQWTTAYGLDETGAVLVRPDGDVGWRSRR